MALSPVQQKRIEGIIKTLRKYIEGRFHHAIRVNSMLKTIYSDISWQQIMTIKEILGETKAWGPDRYLVADILCSDDDSKIGDLFSPVNQNSIQNEIINMEDTDSDTSVGTLSIKNIRTLYFAMNPSLERIIELVQTWIWWDLQDAVDIFIIDSQKEKIRGLLEKEIDAKLEEYYKHIFGKNVSSIDKKTVLSYEYKKMEKSLRRFASRVRSEEGYKTIIKRDMIEDVTANDVIADINKHISDFERLKETNTVNDEIKPHYSAILNCKEQDVSVEDALSFEKRYIENAKIELASMLSASELLGEPYNFKEHQLKEIHNEFQELQKYLRPFFANNASAA